MVCDGWTVATPDVATLPMLVIAPAVAWVLVQLSLALFPTMMLEALSVSLQVTAVAGVVVAVLEKPVSCAKTIAAGERR